VRTGNRSRLILRAPHPPLRAVALPVAHDLVRTGDGVAVLLLTRCPGFGDGILNEIDYLAAALHDAGCVSRSATHASHHATASHRGATRIMPAQMPRCRAVIALPLSEIDQVGVRVAGYR
jgi:hypothetical protein